MFDQAPNNLPTEPEDILSEGESADLSVAGTPPAADTSRNPDTALATGRLRPATPPAASSDFLSDDGSAPLPSNPRGVPQPTRDEMQSDSDIEIAPPILNKRNLFIIVVVILVVLIAGGALWVWRLSVKRSASPAPKPTSQSKTETPVDESSINENAPTAILAPTEATTTETAALQPPSPAIDADGDGLTDQQEIQYGTDPQKADTDGDNLTDYEEIFIWHTNPLNPDTDGDGFADGQEVKNGYNPNGSGKLLNIPNAPIPSGTATSAVPVAPAVQKP